MITHSTLLAICMLGMVVFSYSSHAVEEPWSLLWIQ